MVTVERMAERLWWVCGIGILVATTACITGLGVFQEYLYRSVRQQGERLKIRNWGGDGSCRKRDVPLLLWAKALCISHMLTVPLFLLFPHRLWSEMLLIREGN